MVLLIIISVLFVFYAGVIFFYNRSWLQMPEFAAAQPSNPISFSVIIPARNEEENIGRLLQSLQKQTYPAHLFEVIVVDDHSDDNTAGVVKRFASPPTPLHLVERGGQIDSHSPLSVRLLQLENDAINSYKKKAIETGIAAAKNEWVVCTDADCVVPEKWLENFAAFITEKNSVFVAAPVSLVPARTKKDKSNKLLYIFQSLDFLVLQGITAASVFKNVHSMCNGANLAYKRSVFYEVGGFRGIDNIASGDDMLLMHKIWKKYPLQVYYLKSKTAIVQTLSAPHWKGFFNQRIRWASKAKSYDDKRIFIVLLLVYLFNFSFLMLAVASLFGLKCFIALLITWVTKTVVELPFVASVSSFFDRRVLVKYFFLMQPLHIAYTIIAGFLGNTGSYEWKGRRVK